MVQKLALLLLGLIAVVAIVGLTVQLKDTLTGQYVASGGGRFYYGPMKAQLQPDEACIYQGFDPLSPQQVYTNEFGTLMSVCRNGDQFVGVPIVQTIIAP